MNTKPTGLIELIPFLQEHPFVEVTDPRANVDREAFRYLKEGSLWFTRSNGALSHIPINCGMVAAETGFAFDAEGFTVTKFGVSIRVRYLEEVPTGGNL